MRSIGLVALGAWGISILWVGCSNHAVGVDDCRAIEFARCNGARSCDLGLSSADSQAECHRFADDHCLHGLPLDTEPSAVEVQRCVSAITAAGDCAAHSGKGTLVVDCSGSLGRAADGAFACDLVQTPEQTTACAFLAVQPVPASTADAATPTKDAASD